MVVELNWVLMRVLVAGEHFHLYGVENVCYAGVGDIIHVTPDEAIRLVIERLAAVHAGGEKIADEYAGG